MPEQQELTERVPLAEAAGGQTPKGRRFRARIIQGDIQGSSGFYPAKMLKRDAAVFREGLPVFLDHPGATESYDRPERSVRDLAGKLATTAVYERDGLYADVEVYPHWAPVIEAMAGDIGMSIRASGTVEPSQEESIRGPIVTALTEAASVDFVTAAGAGGKVVALLESARAQSGDLLRKAADAKPNLQEGRNVGHWLESRIHRGFTEMCDDMFGEGRLTRDERIALSNAIGEGLTAFNAVVAEKVPHLYQRDIWDDPEPAPAEVSETAAPHNVPAPPADKEGVSMSGGTGAAELSETERLRTELDDTKARLAEAELKVATFGDNAKQLAEAEQRNEVLQRENLKLKANDAARAKAAETLAESTLPETAHERVLAAVTGDNVPLNDAGSLDEAKLVTSIKSAIESERKYLARFAEEAGLGSVRGLGESSGDHIDVEGELAAIFQESGMSASAANIAAKGRI